MRIACGTLVLIFGSLAVGAPAAASDVDRWVRAHHRVVRDKPRSVFVDPVGYAFPAIKNRETKSGYQPLPDPTSGTMLRSTPRAAKPKQ